MRRGDLVTVATPGDYGKPRPALVIQSDFFSQTDSITVLLVTSTIVNSELMRVLVTPSPGNGLRALSQVMIDKPMTVKRERVGQTFGRIEDQHLRATERSLALFLGLG